MEKLTPLLRLAMPVTALIPAKNNHRVAKLFSIKYQYQIVKLHQSENLLFFRDWSMTHVI